MCIYTNRHASHLNGLYCHAQDASVASLQNATHPHFTWKWRPLVWSLTYQILPNKMPAHRSKRVPDLWIRWDINLHQSTSITPPKNQAFVMWDEWFIHNKENCFRGWLQAIGYPDIPWYPHPAPEFHQRSLAKWLRLEPGTRGFGEAKLEISWAAGTGRITGEKWPGRNMGKICLDKWSINHENISSDT